MNFSVSNSSATENSIRIVQITDSHLFADLNGSLAGMNCDESLNDVISLVRKQEERLDCLLCTGDLVQDASVAGYQRLNNVIKPFSVPYLWIPGNHDSLANIKLALGDDNQCLHSTHIIANWKIIMLNSCVEGSTHGLLSEQELSSLDKELANSQGQDLHVLIGVHHNAVPIQSTWLQQHSLHNSEEFFQVIDKYSHVKAVICGHIHQDLNKDRKGVMMLGSPSTCIQFHPHSDGFKLDELNPGYRWLELAFDGSIKTGVERVKGKNYHVDFSSNGY